MREKSIRKGFISIVCSLAMVAGLLFVGCGTSMTGASSFAVTTSGAAKEDGIKVHGEAMMSLGLKKGTECTWLRRSGYISSDQRAKS